MTVSFWNDVWVGQETLKLSFPRLFLVLVQKNGKVGEWWLQWGIWKWNLERKRNVWVGKHIHADIMGCHPTCCVNGVKLCPDTCTLETRLKVDFNVKTHFFYLVPKSSCSQPLLTPHVGWHLIRGVNGGWGHGDAFFQRCRCYIFSTEKFMSDIWRALSGWMGVTLFLRLNLFTFFAMWVGFGWSKRVKSGSMQLFGQLRLGMRVFNNKVVTEVEKVEHIKAVFAVVFRYFCLKSVSFGW